MVWKEWSIKGIVYHIFRKYDLKNFNKGQEYMTRICENELKEHPKIRDQIKTQKQLEFFVIQMALENIKEVKPKIEFKDGYYEWNLYIDEQLVYTFGTGIADEIDENTQQDTLRCEIEIYIEAAIEELKENESEHLEIIKQYKDDIVEIMFDIWSSHFGI